MNLVDIPEIQDELINILNDSKIIELCKKNKIPVNKIQIQILYNPTTIEEVTARVSGSAIEEVTVIEELTARAACIKWCEQCPGKPPGVGCCVYCNNPCG